MEVFRDDDVGLLAGESAEEFGAAIVELLSDEERCTEAGRRARTVAEGRYAWSHLTPARYLP